MRSLWLRLVGAFVLVILIGSAVDVFLVSHSTQSQFSRYVTQTGLALARQYAPVFGDYYARQGNWQGVEALIQNPWQVGISAQTPGQPGTGSSNWSGMWSGMDGMMDGEMMNPGANGNGMMTGDMWTMTGTRLLLADSTGKVIADTQSSSIGATLNSADLTAGVPIQTGGQRVGTLLAVSPQASGNTPAGNFIVSVNRSTLLAGLAAAVVALVLGSLLFLQIVAPIRRMTTAAQRISSGNLDQLVPVNTRDELGQLSTAFNDMANSLSRQQELRRTMVADIAHELRTPLSIIQGNLEAMLDGVLPANPEEIASLRDESAMLARLVDDLRLLSLAEAGQLKLEKTPTNLSDLLNQVMDPLRPQAEEGRVDIKTELAPNLPVLNIDKDRIAQVMLNLIGNALRHTPSGGQVTIRANDIANLEKKREIVVQVADTGSGIAQEDLPFVFDRFYRADKSRSRESGGSGIGLAIVKQLVEAHGGSVWAESPPRKGAIFSFTLPISNP